MFFNQNSFLLHILWLAWLSLIQWINWIKGKPITQAQGLVSIWRGWKVPDAVHPSKYSNMEFMKRVACQRSLSTSPFSIKNILNLEDESNMIEPPPPLQPANDCEAAALYSIPSSVVTFHVPYNPSPFLSPCSSFGLQQYTLPSTWMNSGTEMGNPRWTTSAGLMMTQFPSGKCFSSLVLKTIHTFFKTRHSRPS